MLKLTRFDDKARNVWISAKRIIAILDDHEKTFVQVDHGAHEVCETPEQILAMPELMEAIYPSMVVPKCFTWDEYNSIVADTKVR